VQIQQTDITYQKLLTDIANIYEQTKLQSMREVNKRMVQAYWQIGKRIIDEEQNSALRAGYGTSLLKRLSEDLTTRYGRGFSPSNINDMRRLYIEKPILQAPGKLGWTHYRTLFTIKEKNKRDFWEQQAENYNLSSRDLQKQIKREKEVAKAERKKERPKKIIPKLYANRGQLYTYKLLKPESMHLKDKHLLVDCGFNIWRDLLFEGVQGADAGDIVVSAKQEGSYCFEKTSIETKTLYTYKALVERIVDADTLWVNVDCGFNTWTRQKLRLRGIDAPEILNEAGQQAKDFVESALRAVEFVIIKTYGADKYDRYLVDIFYLPVEYSDIGLHLETDPYRVLQQGKFLNQELLDLGLAKKV